METNNLQKSADEKYCGFPTELLRERPVISPDNIDSELEAKLNDTGERLIALINKLLKADCRLTGIVRGLTVTRYEIEVPNGATFRQMNNCIPELKYELACKHDIRLEFPIPGKRAVGIEVPNDEPGVLGLREVLTSDSFKKEKSKSAFVVGRNIDGKDVLCDLSKLGHLLVGGKAGSGKSEFLHTVMMSLMYRATPEELRFIIIDPKKLEYSAYAGMPHMLVKDIVSEPDHALNVFKWAVDEMNRRFVLLSKHRCNKLDMFNSCEDVVSGKVSKLPRIVILVDEFAEVIKQGCKAETEEYIRQIASKSRAVGIHLMIATHRPTADVITGTIKANLSNRIVFAVATAVDSRIIIDSAGAERLCCPGDMLYYPLSASEPVRVRSAYVDEDDKRAVLAYICEHNEASFDGRAAEAIFKARSDNS